jgi:nicotinamidase-related amidase
VILDRDRAALVIVDLQEGFRPAVLEFERVASNAGVLAQGFGAMRLPVTLTEQYPKGLGSTVPEVAEHLNGVRPVEKTVFSGVRASGFNLGRRNQALLCGIESHVCVWQTASDLLERGVEVHVARDAVTSRTEENRELGLDRMRDAGAVVTSVETALFELLGGAGDPEFKTVQALIK